ncbi:MAG: hypothetical protein APR63_02345 [Desulfuromonas sp. SDB]|nr:MAG: hypothetical protein APR63_02345 [Desulfuromonas sp. SDB]
MPKKRKKEVSHSKTLYKPTVNINTVLSGESADDQLRAEMEKFLIPLAMLASKYQKLRKTTEIAKSLKPLIEQLLEFAELEEINVKPGDTFSSLLHVNRNRKKKGIILKVISPGYKTRRGQVIIKATVEIK